MKNSFKNGNKYFLWGLTGFIVIALSILFFFGLDYLGSLLKTIGDFLGILSPFIWGLIIAYLMMPLMGWLERRWFMPLGAKLNKSNPKKSGKRLARSLSVLTSEIVLIIVISALLYLIIPQTVKSISELVANSPTYLDTAYSWIDKMLSNNPQIEKYATQLFGNLNTTLTNWAQKTLLPGIENVITNITTGVYYALKALYNVIIGLIASIYILYNHESFRAHMLKLLYSVCSSETSKRICEALSFADRTMMGFLNGRLLDSAIIGMICYIGCLILKMPYAALIAVIVGVTNVIPFFGPFIGAIPSALLVLLIDPMKCLEFIIFIIILQQFDGNILGPKIVGNAIGINGFWIMFSIILGAGLVGFWGMLLGVPVFVIIYSAVEILINGRLEKKNIPSDVQMYVNLDYIEPETGQFVTKERCDIPQPEPEAEEKK